MAGDEQQGREAPSPRSDDSSGEDDFGPALEEARGALRAQAEDLAREVAQRVLGRNLS